MSVSGICTTHTLHFGHALYYATSPAACSVERERARYSSSYIKTYHLHFHLGIVSSLILGGGGGGGGGGIAALLTDREKVLCDTTTST